jgi:hypothetical protein
MPSASHGHAKPAANRSAHIAATKLCMTMRISLLLLAGAASATPLSAQYHEEFAADLGDVRLSFAGTCTWLYVRVEDRLVSLRTGRSAAGFSPRTVAQCWCKSHPPGAL